MKRNNPNYLLIFFLFNLVSNTGIAQESERAICGEAVFPKNGWEFISHDEDKGNIGEVGRTVVIVADEADTSGNTVYVGTENAGLWKTETFNKKMPQWHCLTESLRWPGLGITDIRIHPKNSDFIAVSTAIGPRFEQEYGLGVLLSKDGGQTWQETFSSQAQNLSKFISQAVAFIPLKKYWLFGPERIAVLNKHHILLSKDEGQSFDTVYSLSLRGKGQHSYFHDLVNHPENKKTLYASSADQYIRDGGAQFLMTVDGGENWDDKSEWLADAYDSINKNTDLRRIDIAVSPYRQNEVTLFAIGKNDERFIYRFTHDKGELQNSEFWRSKRSVGSFWMSNIELSRQDPNIIYLGRVRSRKIDLRKAENGFFDYRDHGNNGAIHVDKRDYYVSGDSLSEKVYCANDGGVAIWQKEAGEYKWVNKTGKGLGITQYYGLGIKTKGKYYGGGAQDLGAFLYENTKQKPERKRCGDGYQLEIDTGNGNTFVTFNRMVAYLAEGSWCGKRAAPMGRSNVFFSVLSNHQLLTAGYASGVRGSQTLSTSKKGNFIYIYDAKSGTMREVANYPYQGENALISRSDFENGLQRVSDFFVLAEDSIAYLAGNRAEANDHKLWRIDLLRNDSLLWTNISNELRIADRLALRQIWQPVNSVCAAGTKGEKLWVGLAKNYEADKYRLIYHPNVLNETDSNQWFYMDRGLPQFPVNKIRFDKERKVLYAATDVGMYFNDEPFNPNSEWRCFNKSLPVVKVTDIEIDEKAGWVFISTYGRGLWKAELYDNQP